jgi:hypothetical protein
MSRYAVKTRTFQSVQKQTQAILIGLILTQISCTSSHALTLFYENFEGYTNFPTENPTGYNPPDMVNMGIAEISEGANEFWYGVGFETSGSINNALAVQQYGGGFNETHVGRVSHDAGMVLRIDTSGYQNVSLSFLWRTFQAETPDRFKVGYHIGDDLGFSTAGANRFLSLTSGPGSWANGWTQLLSGSSSTDWKSKTSLLPSNAGPIYIAFWMDNGSGDYGKFDEILITGTPINVPEPTSLAVLIVGGLAAIVIRKARR